MNKTEVVLLPSVWPAEMEILVWHIGNRRHGAAMHTGIFLRITNPKQSISFTQTTQRQDNNRQRTNATEQAWHAVSIPCRLDMKITFQKHLTITRVTAANFTHFLLKEMFMKICTDLWLDMHSCIYLYWCTIYIFQ